MGTSTATRTLIHLRVGRRKVGTRSIRVAQRSLNTFPKAIYTVRGPVDLCMLTPIQICSIFTVCTDSINAIQGAIGAVCEAVDKVVSSVGNEAQASSLTELPVQRAFVAIRPPGHHCGEDTPSGFCFVNNVAIAAAHGDIACIDIVTLG